MILISQNIKSILSQAKFRWVKEELLPLFAILNIGEKAEQKGRFVFTFPLSKENIYENLFRITGKPKETLMRNLSEFEETFKDFIEVKSISGDERYKHTTENNYKFWHNYLFCHSTKDSEIPLHLYGKSETLGRSHFLADLPYGDIASVITKRRIFPI